ncbi:gamma-glutamyl-gamma-aminobutyrate hydrolase family protein [Novosphingobium pokkalii]|uniref:Gamma-glutamyl-gamma-aminobutyrate hydrolase family protein n=1 Tax=Novosphingobium pokkalii TaxID=1770194 RepID=A0ABV7UXM3_9SPHN|nr:gamma-glutamyl-gamma-aminobutyrate hydrolase family protein [Novosphingobium pokkalii]GHC95991.1 gamma-glutamyl-gamma-aminobutyrate hydrolase [Novosphingobium pokkalii]
MSRPLLGVSCCLRPGDAEPVHGVIDRYLRAPASHADADVVLVPALPGLTDWASLASRLDGLLLTGSPSNMEPWRYGGSQGDGPFDPARDTATLALGDAMLRAGKPVFGICRGFQELNVAFGGSLQTLPTDGPVAHHAPDGVSLAEMFAATHPVALSPGGILAQALGESITVNTVHYQGVKDLGQGLRVEATAADGLVEAFSAQVGAAPVLAVQWHPEWDADSNPASAWFFQRLGQALRGN